MNSNSAGKEKRNPITIPIYDLNGNDIRKSKMATQYFFRHGEDIDRTGGFFFLLVVIESFLQVFNGFMKT